jgi:hypothetical protein
MGISFYLIFYFKKKFGFEEVQGSNPIVLNPPPSIP